MNAPRRATDPDGVNRPGRQLDPSRDAAILNAALDGLAEVGYERLSMDAIAARARAGKGALYRRWPSKEALVVDAMRSWREQRGAQLPPDTGSLAGDLQALISAYQEPDERTQRHDGVLAGLLTGATQHPELRSALFENVLAGPRALVRDLLERAIARGEMPPDRNIELIADATLGLNVLRVLLGEPLDREHIGRVLNDVLYPLAVGHS
jgi:AcrR family transcriptional regulator